MSWEILEPKLIEQRECIYMPRGYFTVEGCKVYMRWGQDAITKRPTVVISNIEAAEPGTGQFRSMITKLEKLLSEVGYFELRFTTIQNWTLLKMLERNGYQ